ncbi:MAG: hypothetical protein AB8V23_03725 [Candidatus Midichloria sp.]
MLLDHKARVDVVNRNGLTPLHHSAGYCNQLKFVKEMVGLSAKLDLLNSLPENCSYIHYCK